MRVKLFNTNLIFKMFFPPTRHVKLLPAVLYGYSKNKEKNNV